MALSPDLVVAYSGNEEALVQIEKAGCPVLIFDPKNLEQIYTDISVVGTATGTGDEADQLVASIRATIEEITTSASLSGYKPTVFYAVDNTLWSAGSETFVDELLTLVNAVNVAATAGDGGTAISGYFQFAPEQLVAADPDIVLLPAGFYASIDEFVSDPRFAGLTAVKEGRVRLVNDVIITRPGPRIGEGLRELAKALRPEAF